MTRDVAVEARRGPLPADRVPGSPASDAGELWRILAEGLARHPEDGLVVLGAVRDAAGAPRDFCHEWVSEAAERNAGQALLGRTVLEVYSREDATLLPVYCDLLGSGMQRQVELTYGDGADEQNLGGRTFQAFLAAVGADHLLCQFRDVTELRRAQRLLEHQAGHDDLTGLPNRRLLREHLERALNRLQRGDSAVLLMLCDLDGFKQVNDVHGHAAGDELLRLVTDRLCSAVRPPDLVVRYGGDEFCLLCEDVTEGDADHLVQRVSESVSGAYRLGTGTLVEVGLSVGPILTRVPRPTDELLQQADAALYADKTRRG